MAIANFYLKNPKDTTEETLIYLFFNYDGKRLKFSTGQKIAPKDWNDKKQEVKSSFTGSIEINNLLKGIEKEVQKIYLTHKAAGESPSSTIISKELSEVFRNPDNLKGKKFFEVFDQFIESTNSKVKYRTTQKYMTLKAHLQEFQQKKRFTIDFETLDVNFYDKFMQFLITEKEMLNNTAGKNMAVVKTFLHWATDRQLNTKGDFKKFKVVGNEADIVFLEYNELMQVFNFDFSSTPKLEKVRDVFCLGCFTGLRFSDLSKLKPENIKGDYILINTFKTKETLKVPLNSFSKSILQKYLDRPGFLPVISNQKMNDYTKELCRLAGIDQDLTLTKFRGAERIEFTKPKYEFVSTHTARRTFVTLSLEQGMRPEIVMQITGHKEYKTFKKYIKITDKVKEAEMLRIWDGKRGENPLMKAM
jgi:integrase